MFPSRSRFNWGALALALLGAGPAYGPTPSAKQRARRHGWLKRRTASGTGPRECGRRRRQIEAGQLGISNGLHTARPEWVGVDMGSPEGDRTVYLQGFRPGKTTAAIAEYKPA